MCVRMCVCVCEYARVHSVLVNKDRAHAEAHCYATNFEKATRVLQTTGTGNFKSMADERHLCWSCAVSGWVWPTRNFNGLTALG